MPGSMENTSRPSSLMAYVLSPMANERVIPVFAVSDGAQPVGGGVRGMNPSLEKKAVAAVAAAAWVMAVEGGEGPRPGANRSALGPRRLGLSCVAHKACSLVLFCLLVYSC